MQKVLLGVHIAEKERLLEKLQEASILHIKDIKESSLTTEYPEFLPQEEITDREIESRLTSLNRAIDYLKKFRQDRAGLMEAFLPQKLSVKALDYKKVIGSYELFELSQSANNLEIQLTETERMLGALSVQKESLLPWQGLEVELETIAELRCAVSLAGIITNPFEGWQAEADKLPMDFEVVHEKPRRVWVLVSYLVEDEPQIKKFLTDVGFESVSFTGMQGKPSDIIHSIEKKIAELQKHKQSIIDESIELAKELNNLFILYDYYSNLLSKKKVENFALCTETTICIEGWIRSKDYRRLEELINEFETVSLSKIVPESGELPPVELENRRGVQVFEAITHLHSSPLATELDPSPFLAPFFVLCFALCLTDAFYGLILVGLCLLLMRRIKGDKRLLWVLFASGIGTIFTGAITGGWFGDFGDRFKIEGFVRFKECFLVFDPMKTPLTFLILSFAIGFIQVSFGYFLGFIRALRDRRIFEGISNKLSWNIFWVSVPLFGFSMIKGLQVCKFVSGSIAIVAAGIILLGSGGPSRNFLYRIVKGGLNFYQGLSGTISDILSYSRLMALGLVTTGLAMTVNILVELVGKMPVVGIVIAPIIFILGHILSVGINVLGAFVHSLRLQYAEFFTKFFDGGGVPFKPFRKETKYIMVES